MILSVLFAFISAAFSGVFASVSDDPASAFKDLTDAVITYCESPRTAQNYRTAIDTATSYQDFCAGKDIYDEEGTDGIEEGKTIWRQLLTPFQFRNIPAMRKLQARSGFFLSKYSIENQWKLIETMAQLIKDELPSP